MPVGLKQIVNLARHVLDENMRHKLLSGNLSDTELDNIVQTATDNGWDIGKGDLRAGIDTLLTTDENVLIGSLIGSLFD